MGIPSILNTGRTGMVASKVAIATAGHNISNANTEGYSRQRVQTEASEPQATGHNFIGSGTNIARVDRVNDEYLEKQIRASNRDMSHFEEKDMALKQTEDIFNEMNGDGLNRLVSRFFNEFRKLSNEPDNEAVRESVREASSAMVNDFHRLRTEVDEVRNHIDARLEGYTREVNALSQELKDLNVKITTVEADGSQANDLQDKRDQVLKKLSSYFEVDAHKDKNGAYTVNLRNIGPLVVGPNAESLSVQRTPADEQGKLENALDIRTTGSANGKITHSIKGGKMGALLEVRDQTISAIVDRLDQLAYNLSESVNEIHQQGYTRNGDINIAFFKPMVGKDRAAEMIQLSDAVRENVNNIATAAIADAPGDNRIAIAISGIQNARVMNDGRSTMDDFYNSIVSDIGVTSAKTKAGINQQKDIAAQLSKMREQISGVSIDEETTNLMQFQHTFDASAKVIQVADELFKTILDLKR